MKTNWYILSAVVGVVGVVFTALTTTLVGQIALASATSNIYEWFVGEPIWKTIWNNPIAALEALF